MHVLPLLGSPRYVGAFGRLADESRRVIPANTMRGGSEMRHALRYHGAFERNFEGLRPGARTFQGTDGADHELPDWPRQADGLRVSYMEKAGKRFAAVRVEYGAHDVVLQNEVLIEPGRHMGFGQRF